VIATKVFFPHGEYRNAMGLSRKHIMDSIDTSLRGWAPTTSTSTRSTGGTTARPIEETMEALHDVVKAGKARYIGASSMYAWQFAKAQRVAALHGWTEFVSMQPHYNLLYREEEREMLPQCLDMGVGVVPWSPLARGLLARPPDAGDAPTERAASTTSPRRLYDDSDLPVIEAVGGSPHATTSRVPRSRSRGCCASRPSPHRSSAPRGCRTSRPRSPRPSSSCPTRTSRSSRRRTGRIRSSVIDGTTRSGAPSATQVDGPTVTGGAADACSSRIRAREVPACR
jgi:hypothetical protein